jgi:hypothetical protein
MLDTLASKIAFPVLVKRSIVANLSEAWNVFFFFLGGLFSVRDNPFLYLFEAMIEMMSRLILKAKEL